MNKNTFYNVLNNPVAKVVLATSLLVSTGASVSTPFLETVTEQAEAASTKIFTSTESTSRTQTQTFTVPDITKLNKITSSTGNVEVISIVGNQVTVQMTNGNRTRLVQTGGYYYPADSKYISGHTSNYYNSEGYSGSLSSYVYSGSYTPYDAKFITGQSSSSYSSGGYSGNLSLYVASGTYTPADSKIETGYRSMSYDSAVAGATLPGSINYNSGGYSGTLWGQGVFWDHFGTFSQEYSGTVSRPALDTRVYKFEGTVLRPESDTRVYRYQGNVTRPSSDTRTYTSYYQYQLTLEYETDNIAPNISLTSGTKEPTNQNVNVQVNATDAGGLKQVKWAKGNHLEAYFAEQGTVVSNNTFTATENGIYTVYAEDTSGNKTIKTITINNIDKTAPALANITANTTDIINQEVTVTISFPNDASSKEYRLDGGAWTPYTALIVLSSNGKVEARSKDAVGNISEVAIYQVNNIDKIKPTIQSVSILNDYLNVVTSDTGSVVAKTEVKLNNSSYQNYQEKQIKLTQNTIVSVRVTDKAGNVSEASFSLTSDAYYQELLGKIAVIQTQVDTGGQGKKELESLLVTVKGIKQEADNLKLPSEQIDTQKKAIDLVNQIQSILNALNKAEVEFEDLGDNPTQLELDKMKEIIEALPEGPEKDKLLEELDKKQNQKDLEDAKKIVDNLGDNPTQAEIDHAHDVVKELLDSDGKTELLDIINDKQMILDKLIEEATKVVEDLNERSNPGEVEHARDLINKLPKGPEKDALLEKLKEKEQAIKDRLILDELLTRAETAVKHAENYPTKFNIELAEKAVNLLPDIQEKTAFLDRIVVVKDNLQFEEAKKKVEQAERFERDPYLADAIKLVDALKESDNKQSLNERLHAILDKLKDKQDAEDTAKGDDGKFDSNDPDRSIVEAINTIQDPEAKKFFTKWNKANNSAYKFFSRAMTSNAVKVKDEMPAGYSTKASYVNLIAELTNRTDNLAIAWQESSQNKATEQLFSKAYTLVDLYETSKNERNYKNAVTAIADLPEGVAKTAIQTQLASIKNHQEEVDKSTPTLNSKEAIEQTEKAVANYEKYKSSYYQKKAIELVGQLVDSEEKTAFQTRLDALAN